MNGPTPVFDVIATVPSIFDGFRSASIIGKALERGLFEFNIHDLRTWTTDKHRTIDDRPFGGGAGMVLKPDPLFRAIEALRRPAPGATRLVLTSPRGRRFDQRLAEDFASWLTSAADSRPQVLFLCGRYEGIDERVIEHFRPEEISIGDYVIAGGEAAVMVMVEAIARLLPGVVGNEESLGEESFAGPTLEYPHYTRPAEYRGLTVPEVLLSGNHAEIERWRKAQAAARTSRDRPDLEGHPAKIPGA